jgi:DNA-binding GntR family transcriptional regulator
MQSDFFSKYQKPEFNDLPKYVKLREVLRCAITDGHWKNSEKLPPETEIANITKLSLGTVQKALRELVDEDVIERRQGRGTFIVNKRTLMVDPWHFRFYNIQPGEFLKVYPKIMSKKIVKKQTTWSQLINPNGTGLIQIDRLISIVDEFLIFSKFFLSAKKFKGFLQKSDKELSSLNFKTILHQEYNVSFANMSYSLQTCTFPTDICQAIKMQEGTAGLLVEIFAFSRYNKPVYYQEVYIPPNKFKLYISDSTTLPNYWT